MDNGKPLTATAHLQEDFVTQFGRLSTPRIYPPQTELFRQAQPIPNICLLEHGLVSFSHTNPEGQEVIVALRLPGNLLGAAAALSGSLAPVTAVTLTECHIYCLSAHDFLQQAQTNVAFAQWLLFAISKQSCEQMEHLAQLGALPARIRLLQHLLQLALETQTQTTGAIRLQLPYKRTTLAQILMIGPAYLSRLFKKLEKEGLIEQHNGWIYVPDVTQLAWVAGWTEGRNDRSGLESHLTNVNDK